MAKKRQAGNGPGRGKQPDTLTPAKLREGGKALRLGTAKNVSHFLSVVLRKLWVGPEATDWDEEFIERARVMAYIAQLKLKAIDATDTEKRLKALEARLAQMPEREGAALQ